MQDLLLYLIQVNILLCIIFVGYYLLLRNLTFYRLNRVYLLVASAYALLYPVLDLRRWFSRSIELDMPQAWTYLPDTLLSEATVTPSLFTLYNVILGGIILGASIVLFRFFVQMLSLFRVHLHSSLSQWQSYLYRNVRYPIVPFSFFNKIYLHKAQHEEPELYDIFEHENIHVKGLHSIDIIWFEILWIVCWFNPFVWLMRRAVRQNLEFLTDQQVLNKGADRKTYQYSLLHVTQRGATVNMGNQFNFKTLKKRIMMMNKKRSSKLELSKYAFLLPVIILIGASFTVQKTEKQVEDVVSKVKETDVITLIGSSPHQLFSPNDNGTNALSPISKDTTKDTKEIKKLKNRSEIDRDKDYYYEYDKKAISKAAFFALRDEEVYDILLIEDHQAFERLHPAAKGKNGVVRAYSLEMHEQHKKEAELMLYVVDGKIVTQNQFKELDPNTIEAVNVMKDKSAVTKYGEKGKYGAIEITTKAQTKTDSNRTAKLDVLTTVGKLKGKATGIQLDSLALQTGKRMLFIVDGEKMPLDFDTKSLNSNNIESISVLKDKSAIALYGNNAKDGVMIIKSKTLTAPLATETPELTNQGQDLQKARIDEVIVVGYSAQQKSAAPELKLDSQPEPVGGLTSFRQWVAMNYVYPKEAIDAGVQGTVMAKFTVQADGSLQDIKTINDIGFGTSESVISLLKKSKKWKPGIVDGKPVAVEYTFPIKLDLSR